MCNLYYMAPRDHVKVYFHAAVPESYPSQDGSSVRWRRLEHGRLNRQEIVDELEATLEQFKIADDMAGGATQE